MTEVPLSQTRSDVTAGDASSHTEEPLPPEDVERTPECRAEAEAASDSGESLFITQKPVPEAVRSGRRRSSSRRKDPSSPRDLEEREDHSSLSDSSGASKTDKRRKKKKFRLPKYCFSFLTERRKHQSSSTVLPTKLNIQLHNSAMRGFFECVRELKQRSPGGKDRGSSLPTVDMNGQSISPISEGEEEERLEDIRVVAKKRFVVATKGKCSQPWYSPQTTGDGVKQQRRMRPSKAGHETSQQGRWKKLQKQRATLSSGTESSDDADGYVTSHKTKTPNTERYLTRGRKKQNETEVELCNDSGATVCEPSPEQPIQKSRKASKSVTEPQADDSHTDGLSQTGPDLLQSDTNNVTICSETRRKKKKNKEKGDQTSVEEEKGRSQEEPRSHRAATSVNVGITEVEETQRLSQIIDENNWMESSSQDDRGVRQEEGSIPDSRQTKKKRRKNKSAEDDVGREVDGRVETDVRVEESSVFLVQKKKKRKRKADDEDEQLKTDAAAEPQNEDAGTKKKKESAVTSHQISTEPSQEVRDSSATTEASQETSESSRVKRKKNKKKQQSASNDDTRVAEDDCTDVGFSDNGITLAGTTGRSDKKKRRADIAYTPEDTQTATEGHEDQDAALVTKKKKRKKREISNTNTSKDSEAQSEDSVSVRKEEKKTASSFPVADPEERSAPPLSQVAAAHVCGAQKPVVSAGDLETESADFAGSLEESSDGVRKKKKKKKKKRKMSDHELDFEGPKETCQRISETGVKRKKKRKRNESESVTDMKGPESGADARCDESDEAVVLKKKKKKKKCPQEIPTAVTEDTKAEKSTLNTCGSVSGKETDQETKETLLERASLSLETPGSQALDDTRAKKKKKKKVKSAGDVSFEGKSCTQTAEIQTERNKKQERQQQTADSSCSSALSETALSQPEVSSADGSRKNKHTKVKRRLYNPSEDLLTDLL